MKAKTAIKKIKKLLDEVEGEDEVCCCEVEETYQVGDVVRMCNGFSTYYYMIAIANDALEIGLVRLSRERPANCRERRGGYWHKKIIYTARVQDKYKITKSELSRLAKFGNSLHPSTLQEAALNA